jgi:hypothetical protein
LINVLDHLAHGQAQLFTFFERINDLLIKRPISLPDCVVISQIRQVHVANAFCVDDQSTGCNKRVNHVIDRLEDVIAADVVVLRDGHGCIVVGLGIMPI